MATSVYLLRTLVLQNSGAAPVININHLQNPPPFSPPASAVFVNVSWFLTDHHTFHCVLRLSRQAVVRGIPGHRQ